MINRKGSPLLASASRSRTTVPGCARSKAMPPFARNRGPSGEAMISALISTRGGTPPLHINRSMATQSQLDVCGAPTRMPELGTSPTVCQRASRNVNRANALRTIRPLLVTPRGPRVIRSLAERVSWAAGAPAPSDRRDFLGRGIQQLVGQVSRGPGDRDLVADLGHERVRRAAVALAAGGQVSHRLPQQDDIALVSSPDSKMDTAPATHGRGRPWA